VIAEEVHPGSAAVVDNRQSTWQKASPRLSSKTLTGLLIAMAMMPILTIGALWTFLPATFEGELVASVTTDGLPGPEFYQAEYYERPEFEGGFLVVHNDSDVDWSHLNIQINWWYQTYDIEPIPAGTKKMFQLSKFVTRFGHNFKLQYNQLKSVRIYARRPGGDRATFYHEFETYEEK
jgi:hypothetical protein